MSESVLSITVDISDFQTVCDIVTGIRLEAMDSHDVIKLNEVLDFKKRQVERKIKRQKNAEQGGNLGQHIDKTI